MAILELKSVVTEKFIGWAQEQIGDGERKSSQMIIETGIFIKLNNTKQQKQTLSNPPIWLNFKNSIRKERN